MWILASQVQRTGRLYWSSQRGWTYKELASLYREQTRETIVETPRAAGLGGEPVWFECHEDARGIRAIIETPYEKVASLKVVKRRDPDFVINAYRVGEGDISHAMPPKPWKNRGLYQPTAYRVRVYLKKEAA